MGNYKFNTTSTVKSLWQLISDIPQIVRKEQKNERFIYLYKAGDYWNAFESSAFLLCRMFKNHQIAVLRNTAYPFPVVMAYISENELQTYKKYHILYRDNIDHKVIIGSKIIVEQYRKWYHMEVDDC